MPSVSLGVRFGEIIQIMDDLDDAFQSPAKPDWQRQDNNLAILYAKTADHPAQAQFLDSVGSSGKSRHLGDGATDY